MAKAKQDTDTTALTDFQRALKVDSILHELSKDADDDNARKLIETLREENAAKLEELQDRVYPLLRRAD